MFPIATASTDAACRHIYCVTPPVANECVDVTEGACFTTTEHSESYENLDHESGCHDSGGNDDTLRYIDVSFLFANCCVPVFCTRNQISSISSVHTGVRVLYEGSAGVMKWENGYTDNTFMPDK